MSDTNEPNFNRYLRETADRKLRTFVRTALSLAQMLPEEVVKSCLSCDTFNEETEVCSKFNARPPARVIAFSCGDYANINEEIPF
jgi:hypothetical protein